MDDDFITFVSRTLGHVRFYNAVILVAALDQNRLFRRITDVPFLVKCFTDLLFNEGPFVSNLII